MKKIIAFALCAALTLSLIFSVSAAEATSGSCGSNLAWALDSMGTLTISGTGDMSDWDSALEAPWYSQRGNVKNIVIGSGVTSIGRLAFYDFAALSTVTLPDGIVSIDDWAFYRCSSLASITIPESVTNIGNGAFEECISLTSLTIPARVTYIGTSAFEGCKALNSVVIPDGVRNISMEAFYDTAYYNNENNWENGVLYIGNHLIKAKTSLSGDYKIKEGIVDIASKAFCECYSLTSVTIPAGITSISFMAFSDCRRLTSLTMPGSVTSIGKWAFNDCRSLASITIPGGVTSVGENAFSACNSLNDIYYGGSEDGWNRIENIKNAGIPDNTIIHYDSSLAPAPVPAPDTAEKIEKLPIGTVVGQVLRTDITAKINGHEIPSYNVDGYTYIVAEDLKEYGFFVHFLEDTRTLVVNRDYTKNKVTREYVKPYVPAEEVGIKEHNILSTDIVTELDHIPIESYNINGQTIIRFDALAQYAEVFYDNDKRLIWIDIYGIK